MRRRCSRPARDVPRFGRRALGPGRDGAKVGDLPTAPRVGQPVEDLGLGEAGLALEHLPLLVGRERVAAVDRQPVPQHAQGLLGEAGSDLGGHLGRDGGGEGPAGGLWSAGGEVGGVVVGGGGGRLGAGVGGGSLRRLGEVRDRGE